MMRNLFLLFVLFLFCYTAQSQNKKTVISNPDKVNSSTQSNRKKVVVAPLQATVLDKQSSTLQPQFKEVIQHNTTVNKNLTSKERVLAELRIKPREKGSEETPIKINSVIVGDKKAAATTKQHVVVPPLTAKKIEN